jgi:hypothetical protein
MNGLLGCEPGFYEALGRFTSAWAYVEMGADSVGVLIFHNFGGRTLTPNIPYSLEKKIDYLRKAFARLPKLADYAEEGKWAVDAMAALRTDRHDFIHGLHGPFNDENGKPLSGRLRYVPDNLFMNSRNISAEQMRISADKSVGVAHLFIKMAIRMADQIDPTLAQKAAGKTDL